MANSAFTQVAGGGGGGGGGSSLTLQINGTPNTSQSLLNLIAGSNITITDDGLGGAVFNVTGGGGGSQNLSSVLSTGNANGGQTITGDGFLSADHTSATILIDSVTGLAVFQTDTNGNPFFQSHDPANANATKYNVGFDPSNGNFQVTDTTGNDPWLFVGGANAADTGVALGDVGAQFNVTTFAIQDSSKTMGATVDEVQFTDNDGNLNFILSKSSDVYAMGDIFTNLNGTSFIMDDGATTTTFTALQHFYIQDNTGSGNNFFDVSPALGYVDIGDNLGFGTSTIFEVDFFGGVFNVFNGNMDFQNVNTAVNLIDPVNTQDAATKHYVDSVARGLVWHAAVMAATVTTLPSNTYSNGSGGIGATLTATANGVLTVDGYTPNVGDRILVKNETTTANNGIYTLTTAGTASVHYVLTRATDNDQTGEFNTATVEVLNGATLQFSGWTQTQTVTTVGTSPVIWIQFSSNAYASGAGLKLSGNVFSLDTGHANTWTGLQSYKQGDFQFLDATTGTIGLLAPNSVTSYAMRLPNKQGPSDTFMANNGSGILDWVDITDFQTNGVDNSNQSVLNLVSGAGINIIESSGSVTITNTGGGGGSTDSEDFSQIAAMRFLSFN